MSLKTKDCFRFATPRRGLAPTFHFRSARRRSAARDFADPEGLRQPNDRPKKMEATCLIDHKWPYNQNVSIPPFDRLRVVSVVEPQSGRWRVLGLPIQGGFAIREGVNWGRASTAADSRLQVFLLQFGRSRATAHSRAQAGRYAKFWLDPLTLASNRGFRSHELTVIRELVLENRDLFLEKWNAYFSGQE